LLRYIFGKPGTGKTYLCANEITRRAGSRSPEPARGKTAETALIYIVPEQFSLSSERLLLDQSGGRGLFRAQVLSFNRLAYSVLREVGRGGLVPLDDIGKHLLIRKALSKLAGTLGYYKSRQTLSGKGFIDKIGQIITEFHQYGVTPEKLRNAASRQENTAYSLRLLDLASIFAEYLTLTAERYNTGDTTLDMLAERAGDSRLLDGAEVWIDGFKSFTPQEYKVLSALLTACARVTAALPMDGIGPDFNGYFNEINPYEPFAEVKATVNRFTKLAAQNRVLLEEHVYLTEDWRHKSSPALAFFKDYYFNSTKFTGKAENIIFSKHATVYGELDFAARRIVELVRGHGCRFSDIGVVASDLSRYSAEMQTVFTRYGISLFIDDRRGLMAHPLAEICRAGLALVSVGYSYENVFRALKTGLLSLDPDEIDELENYVLACGIKGYKWEMEWPWVLEGDTELTERANALRLRVLADLKPLTNRLRRGKRFDAQEICRAIYAFLDESGVKQRLSAWIDESRAIGNFEKTQTHTQMWARLVEILDITVNLFGGETLTPAEFAQLLETGFESVSAGIAPPSLDHIIAGDINRSRLTNVRSLFALGLNDALIPARREEGILPDADREMLKEAGVELAGTLKRRALDERLNIYQMLSKPSENLYLSYLSEDTLGPPASIVNAVREKFPALTIVENPALPEVTTANAMLYAIHENLRAWPGNKLLRDAYHILSNDNRTSSVMKNLKRLAGESRAQRLMDQDIAALYGARGKKRLNTSISKLESYRLCPFMYYAKSCLKLKERKLFEIENHDVGSILHLVLERFTKQLATGITARKEEINAAISSIVEQTAAECVNAILLSGDRFMYYKDRITATAQRSAQVMAEHLVRSGFRIAASEAEFGGDGSLVFALGDGIIELSGRIDRIDKAALENRRLVSVIDYKTGNRAFSFADLWYGLQLQLAAYLMAALAQDPGAEPAGILYFKVGNPVAEYNPGMEPGDYESEIFGEFRMSGAVSSHLDIIMSMDNRAGEGNILPVSLTPDGISKRSIALDKAGFDSLIATAAARIKEIGAGIFSGEIPANPLKHKSRLPCRFCEYPAVCGREATGVTRQTAKLSEREALQLIINTESAL